MTMKQEDGPEEKQAFRTLVSNLAGNTAMHGLPHVQRAGTLNRKIFWCLVLLAGTGVWILIHGSLDWITMVW